MSFEEQLKLQAWVDNELSARAATEVAAWVRKDPEAAALASELQRTKQTVTANEPQTMLPESREFFWSKVERRILSAEREPARTGRSVWLHWWFRVLAPVTIVVVLAFVLWGPALRTRSLGPEAEIESPLEDSSSLTFRSEAEGMTVVWVSSR